MIVRTFLACSLLATALHAGPATAPALSVDPRLRLLADSPAGPFVTLPDGAVLGVTDDAAVISRDGGASWERHPLFQPGAFKVRPEYAIVRSRSGAVVLVFIDDRVKEWKWDKDANASAVAEPRLFVWATRSEDGGRTWSPPVKVQDGYCGAIRDLIQTRDGNLVVPLQRFLPEHQRHATTPYVSLDDGRTWQPAGVLDIGRGRGHHDGSIEATVVERRDGSLWMLLRTTEDVLCESISTDGGLSWSAMTPTAIDASSSPAIVKRMASGRLMMAWNRLYPAGKSEYPRRAGQHSARAASWHREELSVAFSDDDGQTFPSPQVVATAPQGKWVSYPFLVEPRPGLVWLTTMQGGLRAELKEADFVGDRPRDAAVFGPRIVGTPGANEAVALRLPDGELRVYYVRRPEGTEIRSMGSRDNGRTWGDDRAEFAVPGTAYYGVQVILDRHGELQCVFHVLSKGDNGYRGRHYDLWHARTTGGRTAWTEATKFYDGYVGSLRGFTRLKSGRLLLSVSVAVPAREKPPADGELDHGWNDAVVFYSDDDGRSWQQGRDRLLVLQDPARGKTRYGAVEPNVIELLDGRVWMLIRTKNGHVWESFSTDGGTTWPQPVPSRFIASDSPAGTLRLRDGRLVLLLNQCQRWDDPRSYAIGGRHVLHVAISDDDGRTWRGFREILRDDQLAERGDRGTAYPSAAETADGMVLVASGQGEGRKHLILLDPAWIAETGQSDDFAHGLNQWTHFEGTGPVLVEHPDAPGRKALAIARTDPAQPAGAAWNFPMTRAGELSIRLRRPAGAPNRATLALTDHYSVVADAKADENAVYALNLHDVLPDDDRWHELNITWSPGAPAAVTVNGNPAAPLPPIRTPVFGVNYLRLGSGDPAGLIVDRVRTTATEK
jgi:predicted neuraminidase